MEHLYLVALGCNIRHPAYGKPANVLEAACAAMERAGLVVTALSPVIRSTAVGPSAREYANGAALVRACAQPLAMLATLKAIERDFGRARGRGQRWQARLLDLDIVLWSGGIFARPTLQIPHQRFRDRGFVLGPAAQIAGDWRDPVTNLSLRALQARLTRPRPLTR